MLALFFMMGSYGEVKGQIFEPEGLNMPGTWDGFDNPPTNDVLRSSNQNSGSIQKITEGTTRWQTNFSVDASGADLTGGTYTWLFTSGPEDNAFNNKWADVTVSMNTLQTYVIGGGTDNSITLTNGNFYTMNWRDQGYNTTTAIFMEFSEEPATINNVSQAPAAGSVEPTDNVDVTVELSKLPGTGENVYLWYKVGGTSTVSQITFTDTGGTISGVAQIPAQSENTNVSYRVISSSIALNDNEADEYYWMRAARFSGESTYQVAPDVPAAITLVSPTDGDQATSTTVDFEWSGDAAATEYELQINTESDFSGTSIANFNTPNTLENIRLPFNETIYWRVRGVNGVGSEGDWSPTRSLTTLAADYVGNGGGSFGGVIGQSGMSWEMNLSTLEVTFYNGPGGFNDAFVIYLSTGVDTPNHTEQYAGRSIIDGQVNDGGDDLRRAISAGGDNASDISFPAGFEATHAIAINTGFGGLWEIPATDAIGDGELIFRDAVSSTLSDPGDESFTFSFDLNELFVDGRPVTELDFVAMYLNSTDGFHSNEGYGGVFPAGNIGSDAFTFTEFESFDVPFRFTTLNNGAGWYLFAPNTTSSLVNLQAQNMVQGVEDGTWDFAPDPNIFVQYSGLDWNFQGSAGNTDLGLAPIPQLVAGWPVPDSIDRVANGGIGFSWYLYDNAREDVEDDKPLPMDLIQVGEPFEGNQTIQLHAFGNIEDACPSPDIANDDNLFIPPPYGSLEEELVAGICNTVPGGIQGADNFNMFGNPYGEALDLTNFANWGVGGDVQNTVLRFDNQSKEWDIVTELGVADVALFENASTTPAQQLQIEPDFVTTSSASPSNQRIVNLELISTSGDKELISPSTMISFHDDAVIGWDKWSATRILPLRSEYAVFSMIGERANREVGLLRSSLPYDLNEEHSIPMAFAAVNTDNQFTVRVTDFENIPADWQISITDHVTGQMHELKAGKQFSFEAEATSAPQSAQENVSKMQIKTMDLAEAEQRFTITIVPGVATSIDNELPSRLTLHQNYPNPFNPSTQIGYELPESADVRLDVYNVQGQRVATLVNGRQTAGAHSLSFDASNLASGVYVYRLQSGGNVITRTMTLIK
jgi:hypothetical protein